MSEKHTHSLPFQLRAQLHEPRKSMYVHPYIPIMYIFIISSFWTKLFYTLTSAQLIKKRLNQFIILHNWRPYKSLLQIGEVLAPVH
jgi:hypothetical protein